MDAVLLRDVGLCRTVMFNEGKKGGVCGCFVFTGVHVEGSLTHRVVSVLERSGLARRAEYCHCTTSS